jgi:hypothetical protein
MKRLRFFLIIVHGKAIVLFLVNHSVQFGDKAVVPKEGKGDGGGQEPRGEGMRLVGGGRVWRGFNWGLLVLLRNLGK